MLFDQAQFQPPHKWVRMVLRFFFLLHALPALFFIPLHGTAETTPRSAPVLSAGQRMAMVRMLVPPDAWLSIHLRLPEVYILGDQALQETFDARQNRRYRSAYSWLDLAINFILREQWAHARECLQAAHEEEEFNEEYDLIRAWLIEMNGDWNQAMALYDRIIQESPSDKIPKHRKICCAVKLYQPAYAATLLQELMQRDPNQPEHHHMRALVHIIQGDYSSAMQDIRRSYELAGNLALPETYAAMGLCEMMLGSTGEACGWIVKAYERADPRFRIDLMSRTEWDPLRKTPEWQRMIVNHAMADYPAGAPAELEAASMSEGTLFYRNKYRIPKTLRVTLQLRLHEPYTTYRTLREKIQFDATSGRIQTDTEEK